MIRDNCPSQDQLRDYLLGCVPETEIAVITEHLAACLACEATVSNLDAAADSVVQALRAPEHVDPYPLEPQCQQAAVELRELLPAAAPAERQQSNHLPAGDDACRCLGPYRLLDTLGQGGMGTVYRAPHTKLDKVVAVKLLPVDRLRDADAVARFEREMKAVGRLSHANVVQAFDAGENAGIPFLVMEYVEGVNVSDLVQRRGPLGAADACEIVRQAALGLQYAHDHGLIHRDVKPSNLMVTLNGQVKILDLGLALLHTDITGGTEITSAGLTMGTVDYMAPEQVTDSHHVDARADLYSLGCTLYKLLCGEPPFGAPRYASIPEKMLAQVHEPAPPVRSTRADVPPELSQVIGRLLAKAPSDRPAHAGELAESLRPFAEGSDLTALVRRCGRPAAAEGAQETPAPTDEVRSSGAAETDHRPGPAAKPVGPGSRRRIVVGVAATLLAVLGVVAAAQIIVTIRNHGKKAQITVSADGDIDVRVQSAGPGVDAGTQPPAPAGSGQSRPRPAPAIAPFGPLQAKEAQRRWSAFLQVPVELTNRVGMRLVLVPPGEFDMGSPAAEIEGAIAAARQQSADGFFDSRFRSEAPRHRITIRQPFYVGQHEVTVGQFRQFVEATGYKTWPEEHQGGQAPGPGGQWEKKPEHTWRNATFCPSDSHPVVFVTCEDAEAFCRWLSGLDGRVYRLPTEAEWEYACRAGSAATYGFGDDDKVLGEYAWFCNNASGTSHPVGQRKPNAWNLFDLHGNIYEWCGDWAAEDYYAKAPPEDPPGPETGQCRVLRGGCWEHMPGNCRSAARHWFNPHHSNHQLGFRIAAGLEHSPMDSDGTGRRQAGRPAAATQPAAPQPDERSAEDQPLTRQRRCAERLRRPLEETNSIGMQLVLVPPGEFIMGTSGEDVQKIMEEARRETTNEYFFKHIPSEAPAHRVTIPHAFYMGKHEVTVAQFRQFVEASGYATEAEKNGQGGTLVVPQTIKWESSRDCTWRAPGFPQAPDHPVVTIAWSDAVAFCEWLSRKEGQTYRLPTEEEWEYACRAGTTTRWNCGDDPALVARAANFADESFAIQNPGYCARQWNDGYAYTAPVGKLEPNAFGLHDMHGNAREWCADVFLETAYTRKVAGEAVPAAAHERARRVIRGGDWGCAFLFHLRSAARMHEAPQACKYTDGFRVVRSLPP
jgi:formylglycine-generating enzyme required for sulfatase activity/anti-sigma factor RsiW